MKPRLYTHLFNSEESLHPLDRAEALSFSNENRRKEFLFGRYWLRTHLGELEKRLADAKIERSATGKPFIAESPWQFNLSHSRGSLVIGIHKTSIGVDLEYNPKMPLHARDILKRLFPTQYLELFDSLNEELKRATFFKLWVAHESWIKLNAKSVLDAATTTDWPILESATFDELSLKGGEQIQLFSSSPDEFSAICTENP